MLTPPATARDTPNSVRWLRLPEATFVQYPCAYNCARRRAMPRRASSKTAQRASSRVGGDKEPAFALPLKAESTRDLREDLGENKRPLDEFDWPIRKRMLAIEGVGAQVGERERVRLFGRAERHVQPSTAWRQWLAAETRGLEGEG
eukprot:scaffold150799_cov27-Tisochrysis_lutea.AAC.2